MTKKNKLIALILIIAMFFATTLSVFVIAHEADHECIGNDCQVCQQVEYAHQNLKILAAGVAAVAIVLAFAYYVDYKFNYCFTKPLLKDTLIALKVELRN